jgi:serpin B
MSRHALAAAAVAALSILASACGDATGPGSEPIDELPRPLTSAESELLARSNGFGLELLRRVVASDGRPNVVLSPLSASMALGMTLNGAAGETFTAMRAALGFEGLSQEEINTSYRGLIDLLRGLDPEVDFRIANALWANEDFAFHDSFFETVGGAFDAEAESADFGDPQTLVDINDWVDQHTGGYIPRILDDLDQDQVMVLLNAIYFDGRWTERFDPDDTRQQAFRRADGSTVSVDMMSLQNADIGLGDGPGYQAAELPYGGGAYAMLVVVPNDPATAADFAAGLDEARWSEVLGSLHTTEVDELALPRFELTFDTYLNDALRGMGMGVAFTGQADFTGMSPAGDRLCIDFVRQKTFIEVDEAGTRAAAATAVGTRVTSFLGLIVDRPFVFALRERLSGTILFLGLVGDPTADSPPPEPNQSTCG